MHKNFKNDALGLCARIKKQLDINYIQQQQQQQQRRIADKVVLYVRILIIIL